jgi:hypothetical protein
MNGGAMLLKQYRVILEFTLDVEEITKDAVHLALRRFANYEQLVQSPETWEHVERQRRLLKALLANQAVLQRCMQKVAVSRLESWGPKMVAEELGIDETEEEILRPVIDGLNDEDAAFFKEAIEHGLFYENAEHFFHSFILELVGATIEQVNLKRQL